MPLAGPEKQEAAISAGEKNKRKQQQKPKSQEDDSTEFSQVIESDMPKDKAKAKP